ncbi:MAG: hypothetical protein IJA03_04950, partial [Bacteroidaceae bacterium]|nr:hypothetical protein [Bacteroidaceae bacterium]
NQDDGNNKVPTIPSKVDAFLRKNNYSDSFFEPCRLIIRGQPFLQKDKPLVFNNLCQLHYYFLSKRQNIYVEKKFSTYSLHAFYNSLPADYLHITIFNVEM